MIEILTDGLAYLYFTLNILNFVTLSYKLFSKISSSNKEIPDRKINNNRNAIKYNIVIPCWNERKSLEETILKVDENCENHKVKLYIATYPNDNTTRNTVKSVKELIKHSTLEMIINEKEGPTTKSQNLSYSLKVLKEMQFSNDNDTYTIILDAEVIPMEKYFEVLSKSITKKNNNSNNNIIFQTKVVAFPFKSKNKVQDIIGRSYYVSQVYIQWLVDSSRKQLNRSVFLKGAGMIFPKSSLEDILDIFNKKSTSRLDLFTQLVEDTKLSIELKKRNYEIIFLNNIYTIEDSPGNLRVVFKRCRRWFKGNIAILFRYPREIIKNFPQYFVIKLSSATTPLIYLGFVCSTMSGSLPSIVSLVNNISSMYYILIPPLLATLEEFRIPEIKTYLKTKNNCKFLFVKEYIKNTIATAFGYLISPLIAIAGYYDILTNKSTWYKTERE